jgi:histidinol-phosphate aminotransferase
VRTLDKAFGLAGARVGYAVAGEIFLEALSVLFAFLPQPSLCAAIAALQNPRYMRQNLRQAITERAWLQDALSSLGVKVYPSSANFLLVRSRVPDVAQRLRELGVWVSDVSNQLPPGCIRVSVGTREQNEVFVKRYNQIISHIQQTQHGG